MHTLLQPPHRPEYGCRRIVAYMGVIVLLLAPSGAEAQRRPSVVVAVADTLSQPDARAQIVRSPMQAEDMILVRRADLSPVMLSAALATLVGERERRAEPKALEVLTITGAVARGPISEERQRALKAVLGRLEEQPIVKIGNLGSGRWVRVADPRTLK